MDVPSSRFPSTAIEEEERVDEDSDCDSDNTVPVNERCVKAYLIFDPAISSDFQLIELR